MAKNRKIWFCTFLVFIYSCKNYPVRDNRIEERILAEAMKMDSGIHNAIIPVKEVTPFKWDEMYIIDTRASPEEIKKKLGIDAWEDLTEQIIFFQKRVMVYRQRVAVNPDNKPNVFFNFDNFDSLRIHCYTPQTGLFKIIRDSNFVKGVYCIVPFQKNK